MATLKRQETDSRENPLLKTTYARHLLIVLLPSCSSFLSLFLPSFLSMTALFFAATSIASNTYAQDFAPPPQKNSARIVSIGGGITEIIYALGQQHRLVGTDTSSIFPAATEQLPKVGYMRALSAEGVISLKPDLVIASAHTGPPAVMQQLQQSGIPVVLVDETPTLENIAHKIEQIAALLNVPERGNLLTADFRSQVDRVNRSITGATFRDSTLSENPRGSDSTSILPKVLFILGHAGGTPMVAGAETAADSIITLAGGLNAFNGFTGYKPMTTEAIIRANPDVILVTTQGLTRIGGIDSLVKFPGVGLTRAGQMRQILDYDALLLLGFGPRTPTVMLELHQALLSIGEEPEAIHAPVGLGNRL
ncbi:MAG TPA: hemin ABC transporter substrate-binding protein [Porticoccaceae bacterium]|nr:hemin ABC transporter substrate-binding protein [Porticoccaceae bacterium]